MSKRGWVVSPLRGMLLGIVVVGASVALVACGGSSSDTASGSSDTTASVGVTTVHVATNPFGGSASPFVAEEEGILEKEHLAMVPNFLRFTPDAVAAVAGGDADFAQVNTISIMQALTKNIPIKIIAAGYCDNPEEQGWFVKADSDIHSVGDLAGKTVATGGRGNINEIALLVLAEEAGVKPSEIEIVELPLANTATALKTGQADIGALVEPYITQEGDGLRKVVDDPYIAYGSKEEILTYYITSTKYAEENPEVVKGFINAVNKGSEFASSHQDAARKAIGSYTEVDPTTLETMALPKFCTGLHKSMFEEQAEVALKHNVIEELPDFETAFYIPE